MLFRSDGKFIGATEEIDQLNADLDQVLVDYRRDYDDETTTEFANSVEVVTGNASGTDLITADEVMALADGKFSISLSTDIVYTRDVAYDTKVKYDEDKSSSYKKVTTKGVNGEEEVTVRTTFVDGVQTDAVQTDAKTIKEAVDEVVVKGKAEDTSSSSGSSSVIVPSGSGFAWPTPGFTYLSSEWYEDREVYNHGGIDIAGAGIMGTPVVAAADGTVIASNSSCTHNWGKSYSCGCGGGYGNYVMISHAEGKMTVYGHLTSLTVSSGQSVSRGQVIGYVGSTGNSTGPHLHYECRLNGVRYNPMSEYPYM